MLPRIYRLRRTRDIERVFKRGRTVTTRSFRLKFIASTEPHSRVAVVVSQKVSKRAVDRNRIKRQVRGALATLLPTTSGPIDLVISASTPISQLKKLNVSQEISILVGKLSTNSSHRARR